MSDDTNIDYPAVLADLRAKREKLDAAIAGLETMLGLKSMEIGQQAGVTANGNALAEGAFLGMSIVDATKNYLRAVKKPQRNEEIHAALKRGGLLFTSKEPINTIGSVLNRDWTNGGDIVRVSRGVWGLADWNPRLRRKAGEPAPEDTTDPA